MKGVVLCGGRGLRLRPITHTRAKQLVPVANKPILFYCLEALKQSGLKQVGIVVGDTKEEIQEVVGDGSAFGLDVSYITQPAPLGLAHAVLMAEDFVGDDPFVVYLGDNILLDGIQEPVERFLADGPNCQILLSRVKDPNRFGVATVREGRVVRLVEKPKVPESDLALVGVYMFDRTIFAAARELTPSFRGELEVTDAIQWLIDRGKRVDFQVVNGWWKDTGKLEDLLEANRIILDSLVSKNGGEVTGSSPYGDSSSVDFKVVLERGVRIVDSTVRGPSIIGEGTEVICSYVGPFTSIGKGCRLEGCEVENSILMDKSVIENVGARITDSLLGENCYLSRLPTRPRAYRFMLGDNSQVGLID